MKTNREKVKNNENAIKEIRMIIDSIKILDRYDYYSLSLFKDHYLDKVIAKTCKKYKVNKQHILTIGNFHNTI